MHCGKGVPWEREEVLGEAWTKCVARIAEAVSVDLVCFTGDATSSGKREEFAAATAFLRARVLEPLRLGPDRLLVVPGNHDVCRAQEHDAWSRLRVAAAPLSARNFSRWVEARGGASAPADPADLMRVLTRRVEYCRWVAGLCPQCDPGDCLAYRTTIAVRGTTVQAVGLDTAWLSGDDHDHEQLWLTEDQVMHSVTTAEGKPVSGFRLALMHHPLSELHPSDRKRCAPKLADHFDLTLRGHLHEAAAAVTREPGREAVELAAGCLFEGREGEDYRNGVQVITVTLDSDGHPSRIDIWSLTWSYQSRQWIDDNARYRGSTSGRVSLSVGSGSAAAHADDRPVPEAIRDAIRDDRSFIEEWTKDFVGREFVFERLRRFIAGHRSGYFVIEGDPGIGKTAFAAQCVKTQGVIHHFNCRAEKVNTAGLFLTNVCAQISNRHGLGDSVLPANVGASGDTLKSLLDRVSPTLTESKAPLVVVVDGLDEVDLDGLKVGENVLYLPKALPEQTYVVATMRAGAQVPLVTLSDREVFEIRHDSRENEADIQRYLEASLERPGIRRYVQSHGLTPKDFVSEVAEKSNGNFIYLRYVLPEIETGAYSSSDASSLPQGLESYYRDHWRRMKGLDEALWFECRLPVIVALATADKPISVNLIAKFTGIAKRARIQAIIEEWKQFLRQIKVPYEGGTQNRYALYHWSFHDFLKGLNEVREAGVDLQAARETRLRVLTQGLFEEDGQGD